MTNYFLQPYPLNTSANSRVIQGTLFGLFVFLFLLAFQPFGLMTYPGPFKLLIFGGYGLITTLSLILIHTFISLAFPNWYQEKNWTVGKNIVLATLMFFVIGCCNWLYSGYLGFWTVSFATFFAFQFMTLLVGLFPVALSTLIQYHVRLKRALDEAASLNQSIHHHASPPQTTTIVIPSQNKSENLELETTNLLFIKAIENYVEIGTTHRNYLIRNTLKNMELTLADFPQFKKCHRSYIVNLEKIESFSGNAQGLTLQLNVPDKEEIPVSRAFVASIKANL